MMPQTVFGPAIEIAYIPNLDGQGPGIAAKHWSYTKSKYVWTNLSAGKRKYCNTLDLQHPAAVSYCERHNLKRGKMMQFLKSVSLCSSGSSKDAMQDYHNYMDNYQGSYDAEPEEEAHPLPDHVTSLKHPVLIDDY